MRTNKCIKKQHLEYHLSVHIGMIKKMRQILSSMWLCALFSWKVDHINPLFRKRPCRCLDSGAMEWNHFWWSNMTNSIYQVSQKYMWKMLRSTNPKTLNYGSVYFFFGPKHNSSSDIWSPTMGPSVQTVPN